MYGGPTSVVTLYRTPDSASGSGSGHWVSLDTQSSRAARAVTRDMSRTPGVTLTQWPEGTNRTGISGLCRSFIAVLFLSEPSTLDLLSSGWKLSSNNFYPLFFHLWTSESILIQFSWSPLIRSNATSVSVIKGKIINLDYGYIFSSE